MFIKLTDGNIFEVTKINIEVTILGTNATFTSIQDQDNRVIPVSRIESITNIFPH